MGLMGLKLSVSKDAFPSGIFREESIFLSFPTLGGCLRFWAHGPFHLQS